MVLAQRQQTQDLMQLCGQILHSVQIPVALPQAEPAQPATQQEQSTSAESPFSATTATTPATAATPASAAAERKGKHVQFVGDEQDDRADLHRQTLGGLVADVSNCVVAR